MKVDDIDLSYSGLVDIIQSDKIKADEILSVLLPAIVGKERVIKALKDKQLQEKGNMDYYLGGVDKICKHIGYKPPLSFVFGDKIYAVNEKLELTEFEITNLKKP